MLSIRDVKNNRLSHERSCTNAHSAATLYSKSLKIGFRFLQGTGVDQQMDDIRAVKALGGIISDRPGALFRGSKGSVIKGLTIENDDILSQRRCT